MSTLIDPYTSSNNGDATDPHESSSLPGNTADIRITDHDEEPRLLRKLLELTAKNLNTSTSQEASTPGNHVTPETLLSDDNENTPSPDTTATKLQPIGSEQGGATRMRTRANGSHKGVKAHQHRELRNLGLFASPAACDADVAHEMKTCWSSPWQSGRNIDQLELTSIVWKIFSTTL